jgi:thioredoxin-like negative regulator of GroEL
MFKRSFFMVIMVVLLVFTSAFASQMWITKDMPSSFDSGLTIEKAFKTSSVPLLIEFYSDSCGTCRRMAPIVHHLQANRYKGRLTMVMMDVTDPANRDIAQLFGVDALPALYVFDHHHMKKHVIPPESFVSQHRLEQAIDTILVKTDNAGPAKILPPFAQDASRNPQQG